MSTQLEVEIYQLTEDALLKKNRHDGTGWDWCWADYQRDWMDATPHRFAYRCLPLTIVNQTGWWIKNPVGFTATWRGTSVPGSVDFRFDSSDDLWSRWINSQFGEGIITWNSPFLFRTKPEGSRLLICGPTNYFKNNIQPLTALIESDWISMSFTMNWKIISPHQPVRFEVGEPLFQAIPVVSNMCADLEDATVSYQKLTDNPELYRSYLEWDRGRRRFHEQKVAGQIKPNDWQKDYFQGRDAVGQETTSKHMTKVKPPEIRYAGAPDVGSSVSGHAHANANSPGAVRDQSIGDYDRGDGVVAQSRSACPVSHQSNGSFAAASGPISDVADRRLGPGSDPDFAFPGREADGGEPGLPQDSLPTLQPQDRSRAMTQSQPDGATATLPTKPAVLSQYQMPQHEANGDHNGSSIAAPEAAALAVTSRVDDEWRRWIAENLMIGQCADSIRETMIAKGFSETEAAHEIKLAEQSPYFRGSELLRNRLKKRDWLLSTYRKLNRLHPQAEEIERRHRLTREEFLVDYYCANRPVIITGMLDDWPAMQKWNLDYFAANFGDRMVEVQMGRTGGANYETEREKYISTIKFGEFVEKVRGAGETNDFYLTANNNSNNRKALPELWDDIRQIPEYLNPDRPGGFFWMGPAGTITPFHHDLTNNFMAQVIGRKRVKIAPSWDMPVMRNYLHCFSQVDGCVAPHTPRPPFDEPQILECILNSGEILFLPIGCLHFVQGVDISVTVSFTNFIFDNDFSSFYSTYCPV